jgi:hypothetical protein
LRSSRYADRHATSGAKSDAGHLKVAADLVATDRHNHRQVGRDSEHAPPIKILARSHPNLIWARQHQTNALRSTLQQFYPAALESLWESPVKCRCTRNPRSGAQTGAGTAAVAVKDRSGGPPWRAASACVTWRAEQIHQHLRAEHLSNPTCDHRRCWLDSALPCGAHR